MVRNAYMGLSVGSGSSQKIPSAVTPQPILLYEKGAIASEKTLAMTLTMLFDGTQHVVIASGAKQSFPHKQTSPPDKKYLGL
ncbi:MAG: hypothetical protein U0586_14405 [Candidatus Brocadiaceae bacterium]